MKIPEKAFLPPFYHRFIFVPRGVSFFHSTVVQISESIKSQKRAYQIAVQAYIDYLDGASIDVCCAVFYGHASDLSEEAAVFYTTKKFKKRFKL